MRQVFLITPVLRPAFFWIIALAVCPVAAADSILDDRSSADALVHSLYNAINNRDYVRAFAYFEAPPAKDIAAYKKGFSKTAHVELITGEATGDSGMGHTFETLPVAIRARDTSGRLTYFAGCYTIRSTNPGVLEDGMKAAPPQIVNAKLKPIAKENFSVSALPPCG